MNPLETCATTMIGLVRLLRELCLASGKDLIPGNAQDETMRIMCASEAALVWPGSSMIRANPQVKAKRPPEPYEKMPSPDTREYKNGFIYNLIHLRDN